MKERYGGYLQEQQQISRQETLLAGAYGRATAAMQAQTQYATTATSAGASAVAGLIGSEGFWDFMKGE